MVSSNNLTPNSLALQMGFKTSIKKLKKRQGVTEHKKSNLDDSIQPGRRSSLSTISTASCSSSSSSITKTVHNHRQRRISFLDEELGNSCLVTQIHYRRYTEQDEKQRLYYNKKDYEIFEQLVLYEQEGFYDLIDDEIIHIKRQWDKTKRAIIAKEYTGLDEMRMRSSICREQRQCIIGWIIQTQWV